jgi:pentatricopeptide repeat protein
MKIKQQSSLLSKYSLLYEKNPKSRVFAPLAEVYRKLGMYDKAFRILKKGIKLHPSYVLGYIVLAQCYYDQKKYDLSYNTLMPYVESNLDNISLQRLFGNICIELQYFHEALNTFKYLLFLNPKDEDASVKVKKIEDEYIQDKPNEDADERGDVSRFLNDDDWVQVDFSEPKHNRRSTDGDDWEMNEVSQIKEHAKKAPFIVRDLDDEYYHEEYDNEEESLEPEPIDDDAPILTLTLVDLYCKQGHFDKALEYIETFIKLHPNDQNIQSKRDEVLELMKGQAPKENSKAELTPEVAPEPVVEPEPESETEPEDQGHSKLLDLVENTRHKTESHLEKYQLIFDAFLSKIKEKAKHYEDTDY